MGCCYCWSPFKKTKEKGLRPWGRPEVKRGKRGLRKFLSFLLQCFPDSWSDVKALHASGGRLNRELSKNRAGATRAAFLKLPDRPLNTEHYDRWNPAPQAVWKPVSECTLGLLSTEEFGFLSDLVVKELNTHSREWDGCFISHCRCWGFIVQLSTDCTADMNSRDKLEASCTFLVVRVF